MTGTDTSPPAWRSRRAWGILLIVTVLATAGDLGTKAWAFRSVAPAPVEIDRAEVVEMTRADHPLAALLPQSEPLVVIPHVLELTLVLNRGAVFGLGAGGRYVFLAFTVVALAFALWAFANWTRARHHCSHVLLALIIAGGIGNFYDRLVYACVRDFLHPLPGLVYPFGISTPWSGREVWPYVSNVADAFLLIGIAGLMIILMRYEKKQKRAEAAQADN